MLAYGLSEKLVSLIVQNWQSDEGVIYLRTETFIKSGSQKQGHGDQNHEKVTYARCKPTHPDFVKPNTIAMNKYFGRK